MSLVIGGPATVPNRTIRFSGPKGYTFVVQKSTSSDQRRVDWRKCGPAQTLRPRVRHERIGSINRRMMAIVGAATAAALGTWVIVRVRSRVPRNDVEKIGQTSGLGSVGQFTPFEIDDDRAAEIIHEFAPALQAVAREA
jgi:hypothetical protein